MVDVAVPGPVTSPMVIYGASLRRAGSGGTAPLALIDDRGVSGLRSDAARPRVGRR